MLVIALLVFAGCLGTLGTIGYGYWHGTKVYDDIAAASADVHEADALAEMKVDWESLLAQNPDTVGWIYMPGTSINYPIVQGSDDEEYLKKDFTGDSSGFVHKGAIFLSYINAPDFSDGNNFIYGHNMNDDTMFAHVLQMAKQDQFDEARTFYVLTPTCNYRCTTFALDIVGATETSIIQTNFADASAMASYITERIAASSVSIPANEDVSSYTKLFTLVTCGDDYATTRAVLFGGVVERATPVNGLSVSEQVMAMNDASANTAPEQ